MTVLEGPTFDAIPGILQHAWRTKRVLQQNASIMTGTAVQHYSSSKERTIHQALRQWREGWPDQLLDFEALPERPSLYQDRAEAYWQLAGIIMLPYVTLSSPKDPALATVGNLSVKEMLERLMLLSDQNLLPDVGQDFNDTYRLLTSHIAHAGDNRTFGALIYREAETTA